MHISLSFHIFKSFKKIVFFNIVVIDYEVFALKTHKLLEKEEDTLENIMHASIVDDYVEWPKEFENLSITLNSIHTTLGAHQRLKKYTNHRP